MVKVMCKKLFTTYTVEGDIKNNPNHNVLSYSHTSNKSICIKYYTKVSDWMNAIISSGYKIGFGLKCLTDDEKTNVETHRHPLKCDECSWYNLSYDDIIKIMGNILSCYFDDNIYYYEIESDMTCIIKELTGHKYFKSSYETCDTCDTCDGLKCDSCKTRYAVVDMDPYTVYYSGFNKTQAECVYNEIKKDYSDIISDILVHYKIDMHWFNKEISGSGDFDSLFKILNKYKIPYAII